MFNNFDLAQLDNVLFFEPSWLLLQLLKVGDRPIALSFYCLWWIEFVLLR